MPPRIPAANELIADKRCYTWHGVLPATDGPPAALPLLPGLGPTLTRSQGSVPHWSPQGESVHWGPGPDFASRAPQGRTRLPWKTRQGSPGGGCGSAKPTWVLSQFRGWLLWRPAEGQAHPRPFWGLPGSFPPPGAARPLPLLWPGGQAWREGYLPRASRHMTTTAVLNCSMLFWMTMPSMARPV